MGVRAQCDPVEAQLSVDPGEVGFRCQRKTTVKSYKEKTMSSRMRIVLVLLLAFPVSSCSRLPGYREGFVRGNEDYLEVYLSSMRDALKRYTNERGHPPQTLDDLVDLSYLTNIPSDPMTDKADWILVRYNCSGSINCKEGIKDIHSASTVKSSRGNAYTEW
jgi:general secretion pathway protein G